MCTYSVKSHVELDGDGRVVFARFRCRRLGEAYDTEVILKWKSDEDLSRWLKVFEAQMIDREVVV